MNLDLYSVIKVLILFGLIWIPFSLLSSLYCYIRSFWNSAYKIGRTINLKYALLGTVYMLVIYVFSIMFGFLIFGTSYAKVVDGENIFCQGVWLDQSCFGKEIILKAVPSPTQ